MQPVWAMFCPSRQAAPRAVGWPHLPPGKTVSGAAQRQPLAVFWPSVQTGGPPAPGLLLTGCVVVLALQMNFPPPTSTVFIWHEQLVALMSWPSAQVPPFVIGLVSLSSSRPQKPFSIGFNGATQLQPVWAMFCPSRQAAPRAVGWPHLPPGKTVSGAAQRQPLAVFCPSVQTGGPPPLGKVVSTCLVQLGGEPVNPGPQVCVVVGWPVFGSVPV